MGLFLQFTHERCVVCSVSWSTLTWFSPDSYIFLQNVLAGATDDHAIVVCLHPLCCARSISIIRPGSKPSIKGKLQARKRKNPCEMKVKLMEVLCKGIRWHAGDFHRRRRNKQRKPPRRPRVVWCELPHSQHGRQQSNGNALDYATIVQSSAALSSDAHLLQSNARSSRNSLVSRPLPSSRFHDRFQV